MRLGHAALSLRGDGCRRHWRRSTISPSALQEAEMLAFIAPPASDIDQA
jgi:hypothetical protein